MRPIAQWITDHPALVWTVVLVSGTLFVGTLMATPRLVAAIPPDYFAHHRRPPGRFAAAHPAIRIATLAVRTVLGCVLLAAGLAMLVLPGQGLLTLLAGILLLDFPGKYRLEKRLVSAGWVRRVLNRMRVKRGRAPLVPPHAAEPLPPPSP